jgi:tRNA(Ile)-lysidine synthase
MRAVSGRYRRPLLGISRSTTRRYCDVLGLPVWDDPHNVDGRYKRVRVRSELLPLLDDVLGPGVVDALARTGDLARRDADALDAWSAEAYGKLKVGSGEIDIAGLAAIPAAVQCRVIRTAAIEAGSPPQELTAGHVDAVLRLIDAWHGQVGVDLPGRVRAARVGNVLDFRPSSGADLS